MGHEPVAIVGVAVALPGAHDLDMLHDNLRAGRVAVAPPSAERVRYAGGDPGTSYAPGAYLDRIDLFDHAFFGLSRHEAQTMDPHQRLALHLVHRAVENACHAPGELRGSRTAVVLSAPDPAYAGLVPDDDPQRILGTLPSASAARVAYLLDLAGPCHVVDTACSGSLAAVVLAVQQLCSGQAELAIAGGVSLRTVLRPLAGYEPLPGIESPDGVCRPFDAAADGTVGGEGGGIVVLKSLSRALADRDHIHAVLRGTAVNHNGYRATGMSAPSRDAQAEVIEAAWRDAGLPVTSAGYLECHGSGTALGDAVEAAGLRQALLSAGATGEPLPIGAVKANLGHLDHASGMAGLFKVVTGLRRTTLYPTPGFTEPHPLLGSGSPVRVNDTARPWPEGEGGGPRRAGLSSFGLTGTNVHVVVEEAPARRTGGSRGGRGVRGGELVMVSAATPGALDRHFAALADFAETTGHSLAEVAHALNRGRDHHRHRVAVVARDTADLARALRTATVPAEPAPADPPLVLLCSGDATVADADERTWQKLCGEFPALAEAGDGAPQDAPVRRLLVRQTGLYRLVRALGLDTARLVGSGPGNLAVQVARGRLDWAEAVMRAADASLTEQVDEAGLLRAVRGFVQQGAVLLELGGDGVLSRRIRELAPGLPVIALPADSGRHGVLRALGRLCELGVQVDWNGAYDGRDLERVEAPTYPFEAVPCWYGSPDQRQGDMAPRPAAPSPAPAAPPADDDTERAVAEIWHRVLDAPGISPESHYFDLGGTSIAGITLLREARVRFGVRITFADLYQNPTVRHMAALIDSRKATAAGTDGPVDYGTDRDVTAVPRTGRLPLSVNQEQLWYLDRLLPKGPLYNIPGQLRYHGALDIDALRAAVRGVTLRHEVLRTRILEDDGRPYAVFDAAPPDLTVLDLRDRPAAEREREARRIAVEEARTPFRTEAGPLLRTTLVTLAEDDHLLLCTWHHIVFDGWSPAVFFRDLAEHYAARREGRPARLPELPVQYADFAVAQRDRLAGGALDAGLRFWRAELDGLRPAELPSDRNRPPVPSYAGDLLELCIDDEQARAVREFSRGEGVTTFVTMLAAVNALLHLWAGHRDVVVGAATSGRLSPTTHELVGYFNNVLPFRTPVDGGAGFRDLVRRTATTVTGVLDHEEVPFGRIVADLNPRRDPSRHPLYTVCYTHQNTAPHTAELPGLTVTTDAGAVAGVAPGTAKVDLTLGFSDEADGPMPGYVEYAVDLFDRATVEGLADRFLALIAAAIEDPDRPLSDLVSGAEPRVPDGDVTGAVRRIAAEDPERPAVVHGGQTCGYGELDRRSELLAARLSEAGAGPDTVVPVLAPRGADLVVGWLGVLKAGAAFVPLDPAAPPDRLAGILTDLDAPVLVGPPDLTAAHAGGRTAVTPDDAGRPGRGGVPLARGSGQVRRLAYVAFTSGSTGRPQGCAVEHGALENLLAWFGRETGLRAGDRVAQGFAPGFDGSVLEILGTLRHGATLYLADDALRTPAALLRGFADERIAVACLPTPMAELVLAEAPDVPVPGLRVLATGGDRLRVRPAPGTSFRLLNMYGPTECAVVGTCGEVTPDQAGPLPGIGGPLPGVRAHVLDAGLRPVPPGRPGELYLGGRAVGRGYHGLPGPTAARFVADPFAGVPGARMYRTGDVVSVRLDGTLDFQGRADDQVEIRGHRIEPAEIERALLQQPGVREAVVGAEPDTHGAPRLVAHIAGEALPAEADLRDRLARLLPAAMLPARILTHRHLPRTANGKLARGALPAGNLEDSPLFTGGLEDPQPRRALTSGRVEGSSPRGALPAGGVEDPNPRPATPGAAVPARLVPAGSPTEPTSDESAERVLAGIWAELLGRPVGPDDDFFAIGGDSVLSVAVAARAERAGLALTPHDVLVHPTLRDLAALAAPTSPAAHDDADEPIVLSPLMHAILDRAPDHGRDLIVAEVLETAPGVRADAVRAALDRLVRLHEPLRFRLRSNALGHRLVRAAAETSTVVDVRALPLLDDDAVPAVLEADKTELAAAVDPVRGPMLRARFYDRGPRRTGILLLTVHHFAYDHISAVPLLEELNSALRYGASTDAPSGRSDVRRRAWRHWTERLLKSAQSDELAGELGHWTAVLEAGRSTGTLPDRPAGPCTGTVVLRRTLPPEQVARELKRSGAAGREAAAAAVACAWSRWRGQPDACLLTVGSGAPSPYRPDDRSLALGWFTSAHPVLLPVGPGQRADTVVPAAAEILRSVPNDGVGYGILRHLSPLTPATAVLRSLPEPDLLVEHTATGGEELRTGEDPVWIRSGPLALEQNTLLSYVPTVVTSAISGGALEVHLVHDERLAADRMNDLADRLAEAFAELAGQG
ncbi:amino acid adenylation domain-containing protein [Streptomyces sp. NPDC002779]|uniref:amino acid adenylation domain-containing protein n=1 Tax=Streptomyces sp. NPDC002779 TaxID=3364664 RepID=UPI00369B1DA9